MNRLSDMTTVEAADAAERGTVVVIPVGAFEQHGPGLPLATDLVRAEGVVARVAAELPGLVVVGPAVPVGVSPHHLGFAGTVSLRTSTFAAVVRDYVESLHRHGWRRVLLVTGHGGNGPALGALAQDLLVDLPDLELAWTPITALARDVVAEIGVSEVHGHAGEAETAQMLHLAPELVRRDRLEAGAARLDQLDPLARLTRQGTPHQSVPWERLTASGVLGDPRTVTADDGRAITETAVGRIVAYLKEWSDT